MLGRMMASAHDLIQGTLKNHCITEEVADFHSRVIKGAGIDDYSAFPDGKTSPSRKKLMEYTKGICIDS